MGIQKAKHAIDYQKLAMLLGINPKLLGVRQAAETEEQGKSRQPNQGPKWRRVEVLKELRALDANAFDHW